MFRRVAIVNRGEPAMRAIHAIRELNFEGDAGFVTLALHTEAEAGAMFVREADETFVIGRRASTSGNPYLDYVELERVLVESRAEAAWVGWGFVAEHPEFAELCDRLGVVFIGPPASVMRDLGDKIGAKRLAEQAGVPVAAWSGGPVERLEDAMEHAAKIGYPLMIKAAAGGGGRGIRVVTEEGELANAFERARDEAERSFGSATVFLEKMVGAARHVEVQIVADHHDNVWALGVRDCSVQRRNQKLIEESSSSALDADQDRALRAAAVTLAKTAGYRNAGTVEFLYQPAERSFVFLEVNTRLQVEHPVTEMTTGTDIVKLQLQVAAGGHLVGEPPVTSGHAIEARVNAEDPERGFSPAPGRLDVLDLPTGPGIRVDTGVGNGDVIPGEYDSMIAKVIAVGRDREEARARLRRALSQTTIVIDGGNTNTAFLLDLLGHPDFVAGAFDTKWLDRLMVSGDREPSPHAEIALVVAGIEAYDAEQAVRRARFYAAAARGRPAAGDEEGHDVELRYEGNAYRMTVQRIGPQRYTIALDGHCIEVDADQVRRFEWRVAAGDQRYRVVSMPQGADHLVSVDGVPHRVSQDDAGLVRAPAPGLIVTVPVAVGDTVELGAALAVLESMKIETTIHSPVSARVAEILVAANVQVDAGTPLMRLEAASGEAAASGSASRADLERFVADAHLTPATRFLDRLRWLILGYDVSTHDVRGLADDGRGAGPTDYEEILRAELDVLGIFADICRLSRNQRAGDDQNREEAHNAREHFHAFLRSLDVDAEDLPQTFRARLQRALNHYGVASLDRTPVLDETLYWLYVAQRRTDVPVPAVLALLDQLLEDADIPGDLEPLVRDVIDNLIVATQLRHPAVGELARLVRFHHFDQPLLARIRADQHQTALEHIAYLAAHPDAPDRADRLDVLTASPYPLLAAFAETPPSGRQPMVEVLARRYYRVRSLTETRVLEVEGRDVFTGRIGGEHGASTVFALATTFDELAAAVRSVGSLAHDTAMLDVFVTDRAPGDDGSGVHEAVAAGIDAGDRQSRITRITVTTIGGGIQQLTFVVNDGRIEEQRHLRGIHPMIAERLQLWRLENFDVQRLPSRAEAYLFDCTAHAAAIDRRLIAVAEIRDLTPVRDPLGRVTALPELERVLSACLDSIRQARALQPPSKRAEWNRVVLYVWPVLDVPIDQLQSVIQALAPLTEDLGLEQVMFQTRISDGEPHNLREIVIRMSRPPRAGLTIRITDPPTAPLQPIDEYGHKVQQARRRGSTYPYDIIPMLTRAHDAEPGQAPGAFVEHDLDPSGRLGPVDRPPGENSAGMIVGVVTTPTSRYPEGMTRVVLLGDPTKGLGALATEECDRVVAALDLAESLSAPVEWFAVSSGAKIANDSGTENMDGIARVLRRLIEFTQAGGEVNIVVAGINVGGQPYWNAEATMLMHTRGILVMTPDSAMVLTGKQALDYSGGVSAEDNFGIGGYDRVMGPNGQAQYWAPDLATARDVLFAHYEHTYVAPGERFPRPAATEDPSDRDISAFPHDVEGVDFATVGEIFSEATNPGRKKPFDIRTLLRACADQDHPPLERWADMADAETAVVLDAHLGGRPVALLGIESRPLRRFGFLPADGPDRWTAGTLFPQSSKKLARAINAASGNRPLVVLANLSGFDGSPESLRKIQLEYGAEIGRAVVNFDGPIVFCVVSRYHGGAFVVFSKTLHDNMVVAAVEGSHASVIGGAPAAAVVFAGEVNRRTDADPRVAALAAQIAKADGPAAARLRADESTTRAAVRSEKLGEVASEFDKVHSVERAVRVGSIDTIVPARDLRKFLIDSVERGIKRTA